MHRILATRDDLGYMKNPDLWSNLVCPIVRRTATGTECAYLVDHTPTLRYGNIFNLSPQDRVEVFASHDAILAAGWRVD